MSKEALLWLCVAFGTGMLVLSLYNWWVAERDERRWRRRMQEERNKAIIREHRYGSSKRRDY